MFAGRVAQRMIIHIVGVETPGLWVGWVDGGETCGVGMHRAVQLERVLAEPGLVKFGFRAALVARGLVCGDRTASDLFAEREARGRVRRAHCCETLGLEGAEFCPGLHPAVAKSREGNHQPED